ncbi:hypothetical protein Tco_1438768 [Tanacetum coccineum]
MTNFVTMVRQDTDNLYGRLDDAQDAMLLMSSQLNMLRRDRRDHVRTARLMETEARLSRKAWVQSMDASDTAHSEVRALRTTVLAHQTEIAGLREADRTRQTPLMETLTLMRILQTQVIALQSQQGPTSGPTQPEMVEEAGTESGHKMEPKRTTRSTLAATTTTTTIVTDAQLKALIDQGVANALAARDADRI